MNLNPNNLRPVAHVPVMKPKLSFPQMHSACVSVCEALLKSSYLGILIKVMVSNWQTSSSCLIKTGDGSVTLR